MVANGDKAMPSGLSQRPVNMLCEPVHYTLLIRKTLIGIIRGHELRRRKSICYTRSAKSETFLFYFMQYHSKRYNN